MATVTVMPVYLERIDPARRMARFYCVGIMPTLFGGWAVVRQWGRVGTRGQRQEQWFGSRPAAIDAAGQLTAGKQRRGYGAPADQRRPEPESAMTPAHRAVAEPARAHRPRFDRRPVSHPQYELKLN